MRTRPTVLYFSPADRPVPNHIAEWIDNKQFTMVLHKDRKAVESIAIRNPPILVVIDADGSVTDGIALCRDLKDDAYTAVVPVAFVAGEHRRHWTVQEACPRDGSTEGHRSFQRRSGE